MPYLGLHILICLRWQYSFRNLVGKVLASIHTKYKAGVDPVIFLVQIIFGNISGFNSISLS